VSKRFFNFSLRPKAAEFYCLNTTYSFCKFLETFFFRDYNTVFFIKLGSVKIFQRLKLIIFINSNVATRGKTMTLT
jgi:hypothetical protein